MANSSIEIEGYRIQAIDNGDGTYSMAVSTSTTVNDVTVDSASLFGAFRGEGIAPGLRMRLTPVGANDPVTGQPLYAVVTGT